MNLSDNSTLTFGTHHDAIFRELKVTHINRFLALVGGRDGCHIDKIGQIGATHSGCASSHDFDFNIWRHRHLLEVQLQDLCSAFDIWVGHNNVTIQPPRPRQCLVKNFREIGGCYDYNALGAVKAIHFGKQLVEGHAHVLLVLRITGSAYRVDLVNKNDAWRLLLGIFKELSHTPCPHTNIHLFKLRARRVEKGHTGLSSDGLGEQRLAGAGRSHEKHALCHFSAQSRKLFRVA